MTDPVITLAQDLVRCPSITPHEAGVLDVLDDYLSDTGFNTERVVFKDENTPDIENSFIKISGGNGPHLTFGGHVDVVPSGDETLWTHPPFSAQIEDGKLFGRGTSDMKGGVAAFTAAARRFVEEFGAPNGSISLLITGDEEGPAINGTKKLLDWAKDKGEKFDAAIVGEPTNPEKLGDAIKVGRRGSQSGTLVVKGVQGHVAYPHRAKNPVPELASLVATISARELDQGTEFFQPTNLEFVSIDVGNPAWNIIPESASARFNVRYNDLWTKDKLTTMIEEEIAKAGDTEHFQYSIEMEPDVSQVFLTRAETLINQMSRAVEAITGHVPELSTGGGTSDARFIKDYCPVIEFGLVGQTMHQIDEHIEIVDLVNLEAIYFRFLCNYFSD